MGYLREWGYLGQRSQDHRGYYTIYDDDNRSYVKDLSATSSKDVLRGIHGDYKSTKLLTCVHGEVYCLL